MPDRTERIAPYVMTLDLLRHDLLPAATYAIAPDRWFALFIGVFLALLLTTLITVRWKISAHMVGIGGVIGAMLGLSILHGLPLLPLLALLMICAGLLGTARLLSSDHTQGQTHRWCSSRLVLYAGRSATWA